MDLYHFSRFVVDQHMQRQFEPSDEPERPDRPDRQRKRAVVTVRLRASATLHALANIIEPAYRVRPASLHDINSR